MSRAGQAQSLTRDCACYPLTHRLWPRAGWVPQGPEQGREVSACVLSATCPHSPGSPAGCARVSGQAQAGCARGGERGCLYREQLPLPLTLQGRDPLPRAQLEGPERGQEPCTRDACEFVHIDARAAAGRPTLMTAPVPPPGRPHGKPGTWPGGARHSTSEASFHLSCLEEM